MTATVLVLTRHPTLTVALTLTGEWHVVESVDDVAPADREQTVVILDSEAAEVSLPAWANAARSILLSADLEHLGTWPGVALRRPYRLDELMGWIRQLFGEDEGGRGSVPIEPDPPPANEAAAKPAIRPPEAVTPRPLFVEPQEEAPADHVERLPNEREAGARALSDDGRERTIVTVTDPAEEFVVGADAARDVLDLLDRYPVVASSSELTRVLAGEIATVLGADVVGIWAADAGEPERFRYLAGEGLTPGESRMLVTRTHPVVADALASGGTAVEDTAAEPAQVTGLPGSRHPTLVVVPEPSTPFGELLVIAGLPGPVPPTAFDEVDDIVASMAAPMDLCVALQRLGVALGGQ